MYRIACSVLVYLFIAAPSVSAKSRDGIFVHHYSEDSDGVATRSVAYSSSADDQGPAFTYKLNFNRISQAGSSINEKSLIGRWRRELSGEQAWTVWGGISHNDEYTYVPYAIMYDTVLSNQEHIWINHGHEAVATSNAYKHRIYADTYGVAYLNQITSKLNLTTAVSRVAYNDGNTRDAQKLSLEQRLTKHHKLSLIYNNDDTKRINPDYYYYLPDGRTVSLQNEFTFNVGRGVLKISDTRAIGRDRYDYNIDYQNDGFFTGYNYTRDSTYNSKSYKIGYQSTW